MKFAKNIAFLLMFLSLVAGCKMLSRLTAKSGTEFTVQIETDESRKEEILQQSIKQTERRLDSFGINADVSRIDGTTDRISVKIYDAGNQRSPTEIERIKNALFTNYQLELKKIVSLPSPSPLQTYSTENAARQNAKDNQEVLPYADDLSGANEFLIVEKQAIVAGKDVRDAASVENPPNYSVSFNLNPEGAKKLGDWTGGNISNYLAVVLNKKVVSAAYISRVYKRSNF